MKKYSVIACLLISMANFASAQDKGGEEEVCYDGHPVSHWIKATRDRSATYRLKAVVALTVIGTDGDGVVDALIGGLKDKDYQVASNAAAALGAIGTRGGAKVETALVAALNYDDSWTHEIAAKALGILEAGPKITQAMTDQCTFYDYRPEGKRSLTVCIESSLLNDESLKAFKDLKNVGEFQIYSTNWDGITGVGLSFLKGMTRLHSLSLRAQGITDTGLAKVNELTSLKELRLNCTKCSAGLAHLKKNPNLKKLELWAIPEQGAVHLKDLTAIDELRLRDSDPGDPRISNVHVENLKGLTNLRKLYLSADIDDRALVHLRGLTKLTELSLDGTRCTGAAVAELQKALPGTKIDYKAKE